MKVLPLLLFCKSLTKGFDTSHSCINFTTCITWLRIVCSWINSGCSVCCYMLNGQTGLCDSTVFPSLDKTHMKINNDTILTFSVLNRIYQIQQNMRINKTTVIVQFNLVIEGSIKNIQWICQCPNWLFLKTIHFLHFS